VKQNFLSLLRFLLLRGFLVSILDFIHVLLLLIEKNHSILGSVVQVEVLSTFVRLEIQVIEEFNKTLVELSNFNLGWNTFYLSLENGNLPVLLGNQLLLLNQFGVFGIKFVINLL